MAQQLIQTGFEVKGSTTSLNKLSQLEKEGIDPFLIVLESLPVNIADFFDAEILIINIPSKNVHGFKELVQPLVKSRIKNVIFISSSSVYDYSVEPVSEETAIKACPLAEIEDSFRNQVGFKTTIVRFSGLFGFSRKPGNWFANGKKIPNPNGYVNMIHRDDCMRIIEQIIQKDIWDETFNGCADTHPTRREFYTKARSVAKKDPPIFDETNDTKFKIISNKKIKKFLDYKFKYPDVLKLDEIP